jgi:hypothetical protein
MTTLIKGDIAQAVKFWGVVKQIKAEVNRTYETTNKNMQVWRTLSSDVKVHVRMINGKPHAVIYADGGYEFFTPSFLLDMDTYDTEGFDFYEGAKNLRQRVLLENSRSAPMNTWYGLGFYVPTVDMARYRNLMIVVGRTFPYAQAAQARVIFGGSSESYYSLFFTSASARYGDYLLGIQSGDHNGATVAFVEHIPSREAVEITPIVGNWPRDIYEGPAATKTEYAHGFWSFNRAGNKACAVVWVPDNDRFEPLQDPLQDVPVEVPYVGFVTSWLIEIEFVFTAGNDGKPVFSHIETVQEVETDEFCIAADYDWTRPENKLMTVELTGFDYRIDKAYEWQAESTHRPNDEGKWQVGDRIKVTRYAKDDAARSRPGNLYEIYHITPASVNEGLPKMGMYPPYHNIGNTRNGHMHIKAITNDISALDEWMYVKCEGEIVRSVELAHNRDCDNTESSNGTWFEGEDTSTSFVTDVTGMDWRINGLTLTADYGGVEASLYHRTWTNGDDMMFSNSEVKPSNFYCPDKLYKRIKILNVPQTIAAIPYLATEDGQIKDACVYAPSGSVFDVANPDAAIDFRIDFLSDAKGKIIEKYHQTVYSKYYDGEPYLNRYFVSGAWAKSKDRA